MSFKESKKEAKKRCLLTTFWLRKRLGDAFSRVDWDPEVPDRPDCCLNSFKVCRMRFASNCLSLHCPSLHIWSVTEGYSKPGAPRQGGFHILQNS